MKYNYKGEFRDTFNRKYEVFLEDTSNTHEYKELTLSTSPVTITQNSEGLFAPIKPLSCTIRIVTPEIISDLYSENNKAIRMVVREHGAQITMFDGYVTPFIYNQTYAHALDELEIEGVSRLSVLKDIDYVTIGDQPQMLSFKDIICHILKVGAGYQDHEINFRYYKTFVTEDDLILRLSKLSISEANFFDDDAEKTPWKMYDVLVEMFKYLGVSLVEYDIYLYLVDYQHISTFEQNSVLSFNWNEDFKDTSTDIIREDEIPIVNTIGYDQYAANDANISYDEIYDKVAVNVNTYNIEELCPDLLDSQNSKTISGYPTGTTWYHTEYKSNGKQKSSEETYHTYNILHIVDDKSNWKNRYWRIKTNAETINNKTVRTPVEINFDGTSDRPWYDTESDTLYNTNRPDKINTRCAYITKYALYPANKIAPPTLEWNNCIAFNCLDDTINNKASGIWIDEYRDCFECPVLEYTMPESIRFSPNVGTSWITIKGSLLYQCNTLQDNVKYHIVNTNNKTIQTMPVNEVLDVNPYSLRIYKTELMDYKYDDNGFPVSTKDKFVIKRFPDRNSSHADYGKGFPMQKFKLQIGDKYWNGTSWTTTESTFYINFGNNPSDGATETFNCFEWQSVSPNYNFTSKLDEDDVWAIPITKADNVYGQLKLTVYTPSQMNPLFDSTQGYLSRMLIPWKALFPVVYMKDFEVNYAYTDNSVWYLKSDEKEESDIVYTNTSDTQINREHDDIECKINSYLDNVPISRSFVIYRNNKFLGKVTNTSTNDTNLIEYQIIEKYLSHYNTKKIIYEATVYYWGEGSRWWYSYVEPHTRNEFIFNKEDITTFNYDDGTPRPFVVDSYIFDLVTNTVKAKFIEW